MSFDLVKVLRVAWEVLRFPLTTRSIPTWKGAIAWILSIILTFTVVFDNINSNASTLPNIIIITIVMTPGMAVGETNLNCFLAAAGTAFGSLTYFIVAQLGQCIPAQAFVVAIIVYPFAMIKSISMRYFCFSLVALLMTFFGVVTTVSNGGIYDPSWHKGITETYIWAVAISWVVNLVIFPKSSEGTLKKAFVAALDNTRRFVYLLNKSYVTELTEAERATRLSVAQNFGADLQLVRNMMKGTACEIGYSFWSIEEYQSMVKLLKAMQSGLILAHASLLDSENCGTLGLMKSRNLPPTCKGLGKQELCVTISEIMQKFVPNVRPMEEISPILEDVEKQQSVKDDGSDTVSPMTTVVDLLSREDLATPVTYRRNDRRPRHAVSTSTLVSTTDIPQTEPPKIQDWTDMNDPDLRSCQSTLQAHTRTFAMSQLARDVEQFRGTVFKTGGSQERTKRFHLRPWQFAVAWLRMTFARREMSHSDALRALGGKPQPEPVKNIYWYILAFDRLLRSPRSVYGFRVALAFVAYCALVWSPLITPFFLSYGMAGPIVDLILIITPTFGESVMSAFWQLLAAGVGYPMGMIVLEIFKGVGGYHWNPYGVVCLLTVLALPFTYVTHERQQYFLFALLVLNFCGILVTFEWVVVVYEGAAFDSPPLLCGKYIAAITMPVAFGTIFQFFILRTPSRRAMRHALIDLVKSQYDYVSSLHVYCTATLQGSGSSVALTYLHEDLVKKEAQMEGQIGAIYPLLDFSSFEPEWDTPVVRSYSVVQLLNSSQTLLNRLREARAAIGGVPFQSVVQRELGNILLSSEQPWSDAILSSLYASASSLSIGAPPPSGLAKPGPLMAGAVHDSMLRTITCARTDEGRLAFHGGEDLARYWVCILSLYSVTKEVGRIETTCKAVYGSP